MLCSLEIDAISIPPDDNLYPSLSHLTNLQVCNCVGILCGLVPAHMRSVRMQRSLACSEYEYVNCMWWGLSRLCIKGNSLAHVQAACICSPASVPHPHCTPLLIVHSFPEHSQPPTSPVFPALSSNAQDLTSLHTRGIGLHFPPLVPHSHHPPPPSSLPPLFANA